MKILLIFGTRPEAIKMAPLVKMFEKSDSVYELKICVTGQHREMLDQVLDFFDIKPDFDLALMKKNQTLSELSSSLMDGITNVLQEFKPDYSIVQGDTTTAMIGALASFYQNIRVCHLEAGLRSGNRYSPFPEEVNRLLISNIADIHFVPTKTSYENLINEGIKDNVYTVGNTVVDAVYKTLEIIESKDSSQFKDEFKDIDFTKRIVLVTGHRRESFGRPLKNICSSLKKLAEQNHDIEIIYPVHLNPNVTNEVQSILKDVTNIKLIKPIDYPSMIWLMSKSYIVITDSGGIQEEAPSLGVPVLVTRDVTERIEGIEAGTAVLVGSKKQKILDLASKLLDDKDFYLSMSKISNPYGDGKTSQRVVEIIKNSDI